MKRSSTPRRPMSIAQRLISISQGKSLSMSPPKGIMRAGSILHIGAYLSILGKLGAKLFSAASGSAGPTFSAAEAVSVGGVGVVFHRIAIRSMAMVSSNSVCNFLFSIASNLASTSFSMAFR